MTFIRSVEQQWQKAQLSHALQPHFMMAEFQQYLSGSTSLTTVTDLLAALILKQDPPCWLTSLSTEQTINLTNDQLLNILFEASRILFIKALSQPLTEAEQLIMTFAYCWSRSYQQQLNKPVIELDERQKGQQYQNMLDLIEKINQQLSQLAINQRNNKRNMV